MNKMSDLIVWVTAMRHTATLLLVLSLGILPLCFPAPLAVAGEMPPAGVTLVPHGPSFQSFADYAQNIVFDEKTYKGDEIRSAEFEIRNMKKNLRVIRFAYLHEFGRNLKDARPVRVPGWRDGFAEQALRRIGQVPPGEYQIAFYLNGLRASNVVSVNVDPGFDIAKAPTFQFGVLEPHPFGQRAVPILWVVGPTPAEETFTPWGISSSPIVIDRAERRREMIAWIGPNGPIQSGQRWWFIVDESQYLPKADPDEKHTYAFTYGSHVAKPVEVAPQDVRLNTEWDRASSQVKSLPSPEPILRGTVTGSNGQAAVGYQVMLALEGSTTAEEYTDERGEFNFVAVSPGIYRVGASPPPPAGSPFCSKEGVILEDEKTAVCDLDFRNRYRFFGKVVDADGRPRPGLDVMATWKDETTGSEFCNSAVSGSDGSYQISGPFSKITYVGIGMTGPHPPPRYNVKPGDRNVDFVIGP